MKWIDLLLPLPRGNYYDRLIKNTTSYEWSEGIPRKYMGFGMLLWRKKGKGMRILEISF